MTIKKEAYDHELAEAQDAIAATGVSRTAILFGATNQDEARQVAEELSDVLEAAKKVIDSINPKIK